MKKLLTIGILIVIGLAFAGYYRKPAIAQTKRLLPASNPLRDESFDRLIAAARQTGTMHIIAGLQTAFIPEGNLSNSQSFKQRLDIKEAQNAFLGRFQSNGLGSVKVFDYIPYIAVEADAAALEKMRGDDFVVSIQEDEIAEAALAESIPIVGANTAWASGFTGSGQTVAIVDSGVDKNHTFLSGKVVSEACYSSNNASSTSVCPGGVTDSTAPNSGLNCPVTTSGCDHGTHVAGIAAGKGVSFSGVAKDANIIAIQVFSQFTSTTNCGSVTPCALYWTSDLIKGLERVKTLSTTMPNIVAVNLSLQTGQQFTSNCDAAHAATKAAIDNLRSVGIATVICAGNFSFTTALTAPACISTSISVGSVDDGSLGTTQDVVSNFSDSSPLLHLLAPGRWINSSVPGNNFANFSGTSMATPHVVGAFAILRQKNPNASIDRILNALITTGQPITDTRNGLVKPRIRIGNALQIIGKATPFDFDGDAKTDIAIFRPASAEWWINRSSTGVTVAAQFGNSSDKLVPGDFTGDGKADITVFRPSTGEWFVLRSEDGSFFSFPFGTSGDVPVVSDFDNDGKADPGVFRPSNSTWFVSKSSGGTIIQQFGTTGDLPTPADYDGDGKADIAIYRPSSGEWWISRSNGGGVIATTFGTASDKPVAGDYTGDGRADIAFFRPSTGEWFILRSEDASFFSFPFGTSGDVPVPGDYDGDGKFDPAVFRPSSSTWFVNRTTAGILITSFGSGGDRPVPNVFVP
jgi:subtilisin